VCLIQREFKKKHTHLFYLQGRYCLPSRARMDEQVLLQLRYDGRPQAGRCNQQRPNNDPITICKCFSFNKLV
jgi:hypothetical protein